MSDWPLHPVELSDDQLLEECEVRRTRHSGPGGQHRNKVETAIELVHRPTGLVAFAAERRSQEQNRQEAIKRLRLLAAVRIRVVRSAEVHPSELWEQRCVSQRIQCSDKHRDFPLMLREAMDAIDAKEYDVRCAAAALGCSSSQLIRFVGRIPEALELVNQQREQRGLRRLKT
ncbi:MAG: peptide chain release factor-like protein [Planctomycetaceae bacterium]|nr:peptide chain release factor-like protein [Planctomycetaceae bacterium]